MENMNAIELYHAGRDKLDSAYYAEALPFFEQSLALQPHFKVYECIYRCYAALNEPEKAFDSIAAAHKLNPKNDKTALEYAKALVRYKNDAYTARAELKAILERNKTYKPAERFLKELDKE